MLFILAVNNKRWWTKSIHKLPKLTETILFLALLVYVWVHNKSPNLPVLILLKIRNWHLHLTPKFRLMNKTNGKKRFTNYNIFFLSLDLFFFISGRIENKERGDLVKLFTPTDCKRKVAQNVVQNNSYGSLSWVGSGISLKLNLRMN